MFTGATGGGKVYALLGMASLISDTEYKILNYVQSNW